MAKQKQVHEHVHKHIHYEKHQTEKKNTAWGIAGFVLALLSLLFVFAPYFGLPLAITAIVFYVIQKKHQETSLGTAALVMGILGVILNVIMLLLTISLFAFLGSLMGSTEETSIGSIAEVSPGTSGNSPEVLPETDVPACPDVIKTPESYGFHWGDNTEGNKNLWLYADFLRLIQFSDGWTLVNMPSSNEFMRDYLSCRKGSYTGENTNKLYCKGSLFYDPEIKRITVDEDGNVISTDYLDIDFIFDISGKNLQNMNDLKSLKLESITCSEDSLW